MSRLQDHEFGVRTIFNKMQEISRKVEYKAGYNNPLGHLVQTALVWPQNYLQLAQRIADGERVEHRLNGAGLKLYARNCRLRIGGDQAKDYQTFVDAVTAMLIKEGVGYE